MEQTANSDRILPETRWVAALVIPFLVLAFLILYLFPQDSERLFAWKIQPYMSAMMLGAAYAGGAYFFTRVLMANRWHRVKVGFLPVAAFASLLGIATITHWDRFNHSHISFYAWAGLYFTTPFVVFGVWLRNRAHDPRKQDLTDATMPLPARWTHAVIGAVTLVISLFLFLNPTLMIELWPWTLTPLTARVAGAMFALPALVGLGVALDARWSAAKIILESQSFSIVLILTAAFRAWSEFDQTKAATWMFVGGLATMLVGIVALYLFVGAAARQPETVLGPSCVS